MVSPPLASLCSSRPTRPSVIHLRTMVNRRTSFIGRCYALWRSLPNSRSRGRRSPLESAPINITPREKRRENAVWAVRHEESAPLMRAAGRPVTRLGAVPRAIAPPMASKDRNEEQRPPLLRREARVPMPGPRCAATRTSLLHTSLLHCSRDSRPVRLRSVPGQRRRSPVCGESRASPSARSWPPSGKCCPGLRSRTTSTSLARRAE